MRSVSVTVTAKVLSVSRLDRRVNGYATDLPILFQFYNETTSSLVHLDRTEMFLNGFTLQ